MPNQPFVHPSTRVATALLDSMALKLVSTSKKAMMPLLPKFAYADKFNVRKDDGRKNLERFNRAFAYLIKASGSNLGYVQRSLAKETRAVCIQGMFGESLVGELNYLESEHGIKSINNTTAIIVPRRAGKTTIQTMTAAVYLVTQTKNVCCFSNAGRQSRAWLMLTEGWLRYFKHSAEFNYEEVRRDGREFYIIRNSTGAHVTMSSYPGPSDADASNLRGMGTNIGLMNIDEFFFVKPAAYPTILPLLTNGSAMLMVSSQARRSDDVINKMLEARNRDGTRVVKVLNWIKACIDCKIRNLDDTCTHIEQLPQEFQRGGDQERVRSLMSPFSKEDYEREVLNIAAKPTRDTAFKKEDLVFMNNPANDVKYNTAYRYGTVYLGIDPAAGGWSQTALVGVTAVDMQMPDGEVKRIVAIVCVDFIDKECTMSEMGKFILKNISELQKQEAFKKSRFVISIERNLSGVASSVQESMLSMLKGRNKDVISFFSNGQDSGSTPQRRQAVKHGILTTNQSKVYWIEQLRKIIGQQHLRFWQPLVGPHAEFTGRNNRLQLCIELSNTVRRVVYNTKNTNDPKTFYEGLTPDNKNASIDLVMALSFSILTMADVISSQYGGIGI